MGELRFYNGREACQVSLLLSKDELTALDILANKQARGRSDLIREGVALVIEKYKPPEETQAERKRKANAKFE